VNHETSCIPRLFVLATSLGQARDRPFRFRDVTKAADCSSRWRHHGARGGLGDFDGDGRIDLFVGGFCDRPDKDTCPK